MLLRPQTAKMFSILLAQLVNQPLTLYKHSRRHISQHFLFYANRKIQHFHRWSAKHHNCLKTISLDIIPLGNFTRKM